MPRSGLKRRQVHVVFFFAAPPAVQGTEISDPLDSFLAAQQRLGDTLTTLIDKSLSGLSTALSANRTPPRDVVATAEQLMSGKVPDAWESLWEGPSDPLEYLKAVATRVTATPELMQALSHGKMVGSNAQAVAAGSLFSLAAFVSALRQRTARLAQVRVDTLQLLTVWHPDRLPAGASAAITASGAAVKGLLLEGASFDGTVLTATASGTASQSELPVVTLAWVPQDLAKLVQDSKGVSDGVLELPLYKSCDRRAMILQLMLPVRGSSAKQDFVLAGAAAFIGK